MRLRLPSRWAAWAAIAVCALVACGHPPAQVHYFPRGKPPKLSDWRVLEVSGGELKLNTGVVPYDLNTPLFSDYAHKLRTVWMPPGTSATYASDASFDFPVGTIVSKTFYYPLPAVKHDGKSVARTYDQSTEFSPTPGGESGLNLSKVHLIETRLLVRREQGWEAFPYVWNADQTEAELARTGDVQPLELVADDGTHEAFNYVVPNENQCAGCHVLDLATKKIAPIGLKARHLNRDYPYAAGIQNELAHLVKVGYLNGLPDRVELPKNANWRNSAEPLDARARAYLDINCGHCHNAKGPANTTALDLTVSSGNDRFLGLCKPPVAAGRGTGDHFFDIVPGKPDDSILPYRMQSHEPGVMMPEQGRTTTHTEGVALIRDWIASLPGSCS